MNGIHGSHLELGTRMFETISKVELSAGQGVIPHHAETFLTKQWGSLCPLDDLPKLLSD